MNKRLLRHFHQKTYIFTFKKGMTLFCLIFFTLFCLLGTWQIKRYYYKQDLIHHYETRHHSLPISFNELLFKPIQSIQFQKVFVKGHYLKDFTVFLDNRVNQNVSGFEVLTAFKINGDEKLLLVNRGWIKKQTNKNLPFLATPMTERNIIGYVKELNEFQFILGKNLLSPSWPLLIQKIDIKEISRMSGKSFYSFILRLDEADNTGFVRNWIISSVIPERHFGYAIQWFIMAFVLLVAYICFSFEMKTP